MDSTQHPLKKDDHFEERLLAQRYDLSVTEKDEILANVLIAKKQAEPSTVNALNVWSRRLIWSASLVAAMILLGLFWFSQNDANTDTKINAHEFVPKGDAEAFPMQLSCSGNTTGTCQLGDTAVFRLKNVDDTRYFAAFAKHEQTGNVIWYFPAGANHKSIDMHAVREKSGWLKEGIFLGGEHLQGNYIVHGILSSTPLTKAQVRSVFKSRSHKMKNIVHFQVSFVIKGAK